MTNLMSSDSPAVPPGTAPRPGSRHSTAAGRDKREIKLFSGFAHVALAVWGLLVIAPLIWVVLASFKSNTEIFTHAPFSLPSQISFETYKTAWTEAHVGRYFLNSVFVVAISTAGTMLLGSMAAYVLARYKFFGNRFIYYLFVSGLAFPVFLALVPLFLILQNLSLLNTYTGLILVYIAYSLPFTVFFMTAFFKTLPNQIAEAAIVDGASHTRLFFQVMLPLARSGLVSITIFNIVGQWNQYLLPVAIMQGAGAQQNGCSPRVANISVSAGYQANSAARSCR